MRKLIRHIVNFLKVIISFLQRPFIIEVSNKKLLTKREFASYFNRSTSWVYENVEKGGTLMDGVHIFKFCGVTLYDRERIESDIISGNIQ